MTIEIQQLIIQANVNPTAAREKSPRMSEHERERLIQEVVRRVWQQWQEKQENKR